MPSLTRVFSNADAPRPQGFGEVSWSLSNRLLQAMDRGGGGGLAPRDLESGRVSSAITTSLGIDGIGVLVLQPVSHNTHVPKATNTSPKETNAKKSA